MSHKLPWASGPREILKHGLSLLRNDNDINRRLALIIIDNAVELTIKTYLGLPKRVSGLQIPRNEFQNLAESFPALLDGLEKYAPEKLDGVDLGIIEWYHRLRNQLYHQGNGLTVERDKVEVYAELANLLFKNLFGEELVSDLIPGTELLGEFMVAWGALEAGIRSWAERSHPDKPSQPLLATFRQLELSGVFEKAHLRELHELRRIRNEVVHGITDHRSVITPAVVKNVNAYAKIFAGKKT